MSASADSAEQIVKIALDGSEAVLRIVGDGAKNIAVLIYALMKDTENSPGKKQLKKMIRENRNVTFFELRQEDLKTFAAQAKRYGVTYCVLRNRDRNSDMPAELMIRQEDAVKVNRIIERFRLAAVENGRLDPEDSGVKPGKKPVQAGRDSASPSAPMSGSLALGEDRPSLIDRLRLLKAERGGSARQPLVKLRQRSRNR